MKSSIADPEQVEMTFFQSYTIGTIFEYILEDIHKRCPTLGQVGSIAKIGNHIAKLKVYTSTKLDKDR